MIKIYIFADSFKHFDSAIKEYEKRLWKKMQIIKLKPSKNSNSDMVIKEETLEIAKVLEKEKGYRVVLNPEWEIYDTSEFVEVIKNWKMNFHNIIFCIGGAYGFDYTKLSWKFDLMLSFWNITMPHSLALLVLTEQVYRSYMIEKGSGYHK